MWVVISYDIPLDKRRGKVAKILLGYGERVQYSVFECDLTGQQLGRLVREIKGAIDEEQDSVRVYRLCGGCVKQALGRARPPAERPDVYIV